jgi:hypothetical protein
VHPFRYAVAAFKPVSALWVITPEKMPITDDINMHVAAGSTDCVVLAAV